MLIKNTSLYDMAGLWGEKRDIRVENGKIVEIAELIEAKAGEEVIDAQGKIVTPGLIDAHSMVGIKAQVHRFDRDEANEQGSPCVPQMRALDAFWMGDPGIEDMLASGVTTVVTGPGNNNLMGGTFLAVKTAGSSFEDRIVKEEAAIHICLSSDPRKAYGGKQKSPMTRMASAALVRNELMKAKNYKAAKEAGKENFDMKYESLSRVFDGMLVKFVAVADNDIRAAVRIAEEFGLNYTVDVAYGAMDMADYLKEHNVKVLIGSFYGNPGGNEQAKVKLDEVAKINDLPFEYAQMAGHPSLNGYMIQPYMCLQKKYGVNPQRILENLTIRAAKLSQIDDKVGSIEAGKDADLLIWSGDPLDYYSEPETIIINGSII